MEKKNCPIIIMNLGTAHKVNFLNGFCVSAASLFVWEKVQIDNGETKKSFNDFRHSNR